ncbi:MAG: hypothetical protein GC159_17325 [Phycisphaera sp.]|nr:hypothetical protein [Phycisphaera sp.]
MVATAGVLHAQNDAKPEAAKPDAPAAAPSTAEEKKADIGPFDGVINNASYAIGSNIGQSLAEDFKQSHLEPNIDLFLQGMTDALRGKDLKLTDAQRQAVMMELQKVMMAKQKEVDEAKKAEGVKFLDDNKTKEGVKVTKSGLQYKVIKEGDGKMPTKDDVVSVHYRGTLVDGTEFDSSYKRNQPATFPVGGVIPGWVEALQLMKTGSKYRLFIPSELAYGATPPPRSPIPANAVLIFDVELLQIVDQAKEPALPNLDPDK